MVSNIHKFSVLMEKNCRLLLRHRCQLIVGIILPICLFFLVTTLRLFGESEESEIRDSKIDQFAGCSGGGRQSAIEIGYSPRSPLLKELIEYNCKLGETKLLEFANATESDAALNREKNIEKVLQFNDECAEADSVNKLPKNLHVTIKEKCQIFCRRTDKIRTLDFLDRPYRTHLASEMDNAGRTISLLQGIVIYLVNKNRSDDWDRLDRFEVRNFSPPRGKVDNFFSERFENWFYRLILGLITVVIIITFSIYFTTILKDVVREKEKQIKESLVIMGLPGWLHWCSWFLFYLLFITIGVVCLTIFLKCKIINKEIFVYSDGCLLFIFFEIYVSSFIAVAFFIAVFFSKATKAVLLGSAIYLLTTVPFIYIVSKVIISKNIALIFSLLPNCALGYGLLVIMQFEYAKKGVQWSTLFQPGSKKLQLSLGELMLMLIFDTVLHMLFALYVEAILPAEFGTRQRWYFLCSPSFWRSRPEEDVEKTSTETNVNIEKVTEQLPIGIQIKNLSKCFGSNHAVENLTLEMYEGHITVLIGHNGAGKTTTMNMIVGMFPPTSGTIIVNGYDIRKNIYKVRDSMGLCLQHNVLYDELTVKEHLYLFTKMKIINRNEINKEVNKYIKLLNLENKRNAQSKTLSGGMKRKLSVGIALCGGNKVVLLDEPTSGVDLSARREIWDILQQQKQGRTILLTTHFMDEADVLGDRIAIIAGGELQCCGSSYFLKQQFGSGYYLVMDVDPNCQPDKITVLLRKYLPNIKISSYVGSELTYQIPQNESSKFEDILYDIENHMTQLGILGYGVSLATLEKVFLKASAIYDEQHDDDDKKNTNTSSKSASTEIHYLQGFPLIVNQFKAMFLKRIIYLFRKWWLLLCFILLPLLLLFFFLNNSSFTEQRELPPLKLSLDLYNNSVTLIEVSYKSNLLNMYTEALGTHKWEIVDNLKTSQTDLLKKNYTIAASLKMSNAVVAWYNSIPLHASLVSASVMSNALYKTVFGKEYSISFTYQPISKKTENGHDQKFAEVLAADKFLAFTTIIIIIVTCLYVIFYIQEQSCGFKQLQFLAGVNVFIFWAISYFYDLITYLIMILIFVIIYFTMNIESSHGVDVIVSFFMHFIYFFLPFIYLLSFVVKSPATGLKILFTLGFMSYIMLLTVYLLQFLENQQKLYKTLNWIFLISPYYALVYGQFAFAYEPLIQYFCSPKREQLHLFGFQFNCEDNLYSLKTFRLGPALLICIVMGILLPIILLLKEFGVLKITAYSILRNKSLPVKYTSLEDDVEEEKNKVKNTDLEILTKSYNIVLRNLTKYYRKRVVNDLCLTVKPYECFGLLGTNGAGKTTTLKMVIGETFISYGDVWVQHLNIKKHPRKIQTLIGYCPQSDALLDELTVGETLKIFALIRGIPNCNSQQIIEEFAKSLDILKYLDKTVKGLSGGTKRKVNTAIALIGDPPILYLDEPTTGMDPKTKRFFWNLIIKLRDSGKSIILTSHSMEECEVLCTRVAIMVDGNLKCLGSVQRLKSKFAQGYSLTIKMKKETDLDSKIAAVSSFIENKFSGSRLKEKYEYQLYYELVNVRMPLSRAFGIMENNKKKLAIEDYTLEQCSLEQVFLNFAKK